MALPVLDDKADERYHRQHRATNRTVEAVTSETATDDSDTSRHPLWPLETLEGAHPLVCWEAIFCETMREGLVRRLRLAESAQTLSRLS